MLTHYDRARGSSHHFLHTVTTSASPEAVFGVWADVARWPTWDPALAWSVLDVPFATGARGKLRSRGSPASAFEVVLVEPARRSSFATSLPAGRLVVDRRIEPGSPTRFTHEVRFEGIGGWALGFLLGPSFKRALPDAMERLRRVAEGSEP